MIDITLFRDKDDLEKIKKSEISRFKDTKLVDEIAEMDAERIRVQFQIEQHAKDINGRLKEIATAMKEKKMDKEEILKKYDTLSLKSSRDALQARADELNTLINEKLNTIGNILDPSVPVAKTEDGNVVTNTHLEGNYTKPKPFAELMARFTNSEAGSKVFGHRGYFLEGKMARLATALKMHAINFLNKKEYTPIQTPVMIRKECMALTAQLSDFDEQLYHVANEDVYLIATSEQPLTTLFWNSRLQDEDLPKVYAGESLCFRKEAGAHGKDNAGIFRVHQFEKIEQFIVCKPEDSESWHEKILETSEEFLRSLGLPFRTVLIASGEMNDSAAKKYDVEAWFPNAQKYRELVSASNCTDYQSRNLNAYYGYTDKQSDRKEKPRYVHMLNGTLCAVQRTLCCIVENYQEEDGRIRVPEVLKAYVGFEYI